MPQLMIIDGIPVTDEERNKAEMYFADQFPVSSSWSFARVCNLQMVFQFSCYFSPLYRRGIKMSNVCRWYYIWWVGEPVFGIARLMIQCS